MGTLCSKQEENYAANESNLKNKKLLQSNEANLNKNESQSLQPQKQPLK